MPYLISLIPLLFSTIFVSKLVERVDELYEENDIKPENKDIFDKELDEVSTE